MISRILDVNVDIVITKVNLNTETLQLASLFINVDIDNQ